MEDGYLLCSLKLTITDVCTLTHNIHTHTRTHTHTHKYTRHADILGSTAFYPVKTDIQGNIDKLKKHFLSNPMLDTLQKLVQLEVDAGTTEKSGSATDALMWLKRALHFITAFLGAVGDGEKDLTVAAQNAYVGCTCAHTSTLARTRADA